MWPARAFGALAGTGGALAVVVLVGGVPSVSTIAADVWMGITGSWPPETWGWPEVAVVGTYAMVVGAVTGWAVAPTATGEGTRRAAIGALTATMLSGFWFWLPITLLMVVRLFTSPALGGTLAFTWTFAIGPIGLLAPAIGIVAIGWTVALRAADRAWGFSKAMRDS